MFYMVASCRFHKNVHGVENIAEHRGVLATLLGPFVSANKSKSCQVNAPRVYRALI